MNALVEVDNAAPEMPEAFATLEALNVDLTCEGGPVGDGVSSRD